MRCAMRLDRTGPQRRGEANSSSPCHARGRVNLVLRDAKTETPLRREQQFMRYQVTYRLTQNPFEPAQWPITEPSCTPASPGEIDDLLSRKGAAFPPKPASAADPTKWSPSAYSQPSGAKIGLVDEPADGQARPQYASSSATTLCMNSPGSGLSTAAQSRASPVAIKHCLALTGRCASIESRGDRTRPDTQTQPCVQRAQRRHDGESVLCERGRYQP